jgi:hypothetical protein
MSYHLSQLKNIYENLRTMSHHLSPLKNDSKNSIKSSHTTSLSPLKNNSEYLLIFPILIIFGSIIFHLKLNLAKNYLMSPLLHMIFNFLLNCLLLFLQ